MRKGSHRPALGRDRNGKPIQNPGTRGRQKLAEFNALSRNGEPIVDSDGNVICDNNGEPLCKMPILIVIIDELAELRMQDSWKDSETYIARIAQLGRASGVHIVVATQRPSTNIITGVIKANLPTRIAFRVMQLVDSRVILDVPGAENLLGMGDMLYLAPGGMNIERVQGALVDDKGHQGDCEIRLRTAPAELQRPGDRRGRGAG
ncbi:MAG: hypothetical protein L6W00_14025 [Lentisphaeria bacterium]|nr:MAG: hypothetical protein L6W00_14025 [Lentisphaeria bacterium]